MTDTRLPSSRLGDTFWQIGAVAQIGGSVIAQIGAYAEAVGREGQIKAGALTADHRAVLDDLGASQAARAAQDVVREGRRARGRYGLRAAQEQATANVSAAARGVQAGVGSAADVQASLRYAQVADELTIDSNTLRQRQALERQALERRQSARMNRVSAENMRRSAGAISPGLAAATQALQGLGNVASTFAARYR